MKHLSLLVLTPSLHTHQPLLLEALHAHTISAGCSTRVGQSWRSEGAPDKTLLCICQGVSTSLPSLPYKNCEVQLSLNRGHDTRGAAWNLQIPLKTGWQAVNNKEVGLEGVTQGQWSAQSPQSAEHRSDRQSVTALISAFYVVKTLHLHSRVLSCSLSPAERLRSEDKTQGTPFVLSGKM